jgi:ribose transport system substrate-binding protein
MSPRIAAGSLAAAALTTLAGVTGAIAPAGAASKIGQGKTLVYVSGVKADPAFTAVACGVKSIGKQTGATVKIENPDEFTATSQIPVINAAAATKPDVLIVSTNNAKAEAAPLKKIAGTGVKVVTALNSLTDTSALTAEVVSDNVQGGRAAVDQVVHLLGSKGGKVALITFMPGASTSTDDRTKGFLAQIKKYPKLKYVGQTNVNTINPSDYTAAMNAVLAKNPDLAAVVGTFPGASVGISTALRQRHLTGKVKNVGFDAVTTTLNNLKNGSLQAIVNYDYAQEGAQAATQALNAIAGKPVRKSAALKAIVVTKQNMKKASIAKTFQLLKCAS